MKLGQPVQVKLGAYEHTVYGALQGTVVSISPDAMGDPERAALPGGTRYRALVRADPGRLRQAGKPLAVLPGMTAQVEIRTGQRSVPGFLWRPLLKTQEAFTERQRREHNGACRIRD